MYDFVRPYVYTCNIRLAKLVYPGIHLAPVHFHTHTHAPMYVLTKYAHIHVRVLYELPSESEKIYLLPYYTRMYINDK